MTECAVCNVYLFWMKRVGLAIFLCLLSYFLVIPIVWTAFVHGRVGVIDGGGRMKIDAVIPWLGRELWCYEGMWLRDGTRRIELPDGGFMEYEPPNFHGYSYVWDMEVE